MILSERHERNSLIGHPRSHAAAGLRDYESEPLNEYMTRAS
jgi:hypothetical protein